MKHQLVLCIATSNDELPFPSSHLNVTIFAELNPASIPTALHLALMLHNIAKFLSNTF